jgi:hypothetical protein
MHFTNSGEDALGKLAGGVEPALIAILSDIKRLFSSSRWRYARRNRSH